MAAGAKIEVRRVPALTPLGAERGCSFAVRTAGPDDLGFIDSLQKTFRNEVGFLPRAALREHVEKGRVSIGFENGDAAGYILIKPGYQGDPRNAILYQCAIEYSAQRRLLGRCLLEHALSLCPSGTKLASAWVAQDIEANHFWEHCGFQPIAARRGSASRGRVHLFWQRRTDPADAGTALTAPRVTRGGLMRRASAVMPLERGGAWRAVRTEEIPEAAAGEVAPGGVAAGGPPSVREQGRAFVRGGGEWLYIIVNGVGRYLPVVASLEVPEFMDLPGSSVAMGGAGGAGSGVAMPRSRIPLLKAA